MEELPSRATVRKWIELLNNIADHEEVGQDVIWLMRDFGRRLAEPRILPPLLAVEQHLLKAIGIIGRLQRLPEIGVALGERWKRFCILDVNHTKRLPWGDVADASDVFPDSNMINELFEREIVAKNLSAIDLMRLESTRPDLTGSPLFERAWENLGRAMFRDRLTGEPLPFYGRMATLIAQTSNLSLRAPQRTQFLWFNYALQRLARTFRPIPLTMAHAFDWAEGSRIPNAHNNFFTGIPYCPRLIDHVRRSFDSLGLSAPFTAALGLVDHPGAASRVFLPLTKGWSERVVGVLAEADEQDHFDQFPIVVPARTGTSLHDIAAPRWVTRRHPTTGATEGRFELPPGAQVLWTMDPRMRHELPRWRERVAAWQRNQPQTGGSLELHVPMVAVATEGDPWQSDPPIVARQTLVFSTEHPDRVAVVYSYVNWQAYAEVYFEAAQRGSVETILAPVPAVADKCITKQLDKLLRSLRTSYSGLADLGSMYDDFCMHLELVTPFATAPAVSAKSRYERREAAGLEAHATQVALFKWCFDPREESATVAPPPFMLSRENGNPYRLLVQRDPSLRNNHAHRNAEVLLV